MCGRFVGNYGTDDLLGELGAALDAAGIELATPSFDGPLLRNFNVAPTVPIPIVRMDGETMIVDVVRWGLVPVWSKDPSVASRMINARSETVTEKPSFRGLVEGHRCIIPMSGFYEWDRSDPRHKVPYYVTRADGRLMLGAGLWSESPIVDGGRTCALLTRDSVHDLSMIHDRSPVEFHAEEAVEWVASATAPLGLFGPDHQPRFAVRRVSTRVNSVRNNDPSLIEPDDDGPDEGQPTLF